MPSEDSLSKDWALGRITTAFVAVCFACCAYFASFVSEHSAEYHRHIAEVASARTKAATEAADAKARSEERDREMSQQLKEIKEAIRELRRQLSDEDRK